MIFVETYDIILKAFLDPKYHTLIIQGGTSSSKTYSIMQLLYYFSLNNKKKELISVVSENMPHLKRGAIRDLKNILGSEQLWNDKDFNKTESIYICKNKTIEFFGADSPSKLVGARRDYLYMNEANHISKDAYDQLDVRTAKKTIIDYNPTHEFWADNLVGQEGVFFINVTYHNNKALAQKIIDKIESRKYNKDGSISEWYKVYGLGQRGTLEGAIYKNWKQVDSMPLDLSNEMGFLDFGYTNDPTAIGRAGISNNELYCEELVYEHGLTNPQIAHRIKAKNMQHLTYICESAEPKSIQELRDNGIDAIGVVKGKGSINYGIDLINVKGFYITKASLNGVNELRNYQWKKDKKTGKYTNIPIDDFNHFLDAFRYYALTCIDETLRPKAIPIPKARKRNNTRYK